MVPYQYYILDAARASSSFENAIKYLNINKSLYEGSSRADLFGVAPYLFALAQNQEFEKWIIENGHGDSWGIFISTPVSFEDCFSHFRKFITVKTEEGKQLYFRFYDPRVLRIFLPTCNTEQLKEFFGPVKMFTMEDEDPAYVLQFWLENYNLKSKRITAEEAFGIKVTSTAKSQNETGSESEENSETHVKRKRTFS